MQLEISEFSREINRSLSFNKVFPLATSFIKQGLADKIIFITAPMMIGLGVNSIGDLGISKLAEAVRFKRADFRLLGQDSLFIGYPEKVT